jgi:hypothetical protein
LAKTEIQKDGIPVISAEDLPLLLQKGYRDTLFLIVTERMKILDCVVLHAQKNLEKFHQVRDVYRNIAHQQISKIIDMKNIFKVHRDEKGVAKWDTVQQRFAFGFAVVSFVILLPIVFFTFAWAFYWIATGKNLFLKILGEE